MELLKAFSIVALTAAAAGAQPTVWVVGDSTANNVNRRGWGDPFAD
ncbi:MAG TPA: hypothetical protein VMJ75_19400 [Candidatus Acidoferrales bacterium]|nr:hypothetical protein [Candidatus Acidoferrales bacterium]